MDALEFVDSVVEQRLDVPGRTIYLSGEVNDKMALRLAASLKILQHTRGDVTIWLNSGGGAEDPGFAMYDMLRSFPQRTHAIGMGAVMSIAALVFQACDNRMLYPSTRFMIHNGSYAGFSKDEQQNHIIDRAKEMEVVNRKYAEVLAYHSRQPLRKVLNWCRGDKFFSAEQAVKAGFADSVMGTEPPSVRSRP